MTVKQVYEYLLIELNKVKAPAVLLADFNYFLNRTISQYINKRYNLYNINLQTADDLRVLKKSVKLTGREKSDYGWLFRIPDDYYHLLGCICNYTYDGTSSGCSQISRKSSYAPKKLTEDSWAVIINDYYNKPAHDNPYYIITTKPKENDGLVEIDLKLNEDLKENVKYNSEFFHKESDFNVYVTESETANTRDGNLASPIIEIRDGDEPGYSLESINVSYLRTPKYYKLTNILLDLVQDASLTLEFPDYVNLEILNELVTNILEYHSDPRVQSHVALSLSIAGPSNAALA